MVNGHRLENWKYENLGKVILWVIQKSLIEKQVVRILKS